MRKVKFGLFDPQVGQSFTDYRDRAQLAEKLGYDSIFCVDHMWQKGMPEVDHLEAWTTLSALAPLTSKIRLGALVLCNSYRSPALLAKMAAPKRFRAAVAALRPAWRFSPLLGAQGAYYRARYGPEADGRTATRRPGSEILPSATVRYLGLMSNLPLVRTIRGNPIFAWRVNFDFGSVNFDGKANNYFVRAVRGD